MPELDNFKVGSRIKAKIMQVDPGWGSKTRKWLRENLNKIVDGTVKDSQDGILFYPDGIEKIGLVDHEIEIQSEVKAEEKSSSQEAINLAVAELIENAGLDMVLNAIVNVAEISISVGHQDLDDIALQKQRETNINRMEEIFKEIQAMNPSPINN